MGLETDFNVSPYFDDFNEEKNFHRVLFKPSQAVQARELTQLQTILQNQIERFGENVLKEGTIIKGGNFVEEANLSYVKIEDNNAASESVIVSQYENLFVVGQTTGLRAFIVKTIAGSETQAPDLNTLYINYLNTGPAGQKVFADGETLIITDANDAEVDRVSAAVANATGLGYGVRCGDGVIFHKGVFIRFEDDITIVSKYSNTPDDIVVGFQTTEEIINSDIDSSLLDNANGFNNFNAPGADRIKLTPVLTTLTLTEAENDEDFFALQEYQRGLVVRRRLTTQYNEIEKFVEKRTVESEGDYSYRRFPLKIENNREANTSLLTCLVSPGIAYVEGKRTEIVNNYPIDFRKGLDTATAETQNIVANFGHYILVDNVSGYFDTDSFEEIDLLDNGAATIGTANIRSFVRESSTQFRAYIFNTNIVSGETISDVKSISGSNGSADVVLNTANTFTIQEFSFLPAIFETGASAIDTFDFSSTDYVYRKVNSNLNILSDGTITIVANTSNNEEWQYQAGSTLNETQKNDFIVVANESGGSYSNNEVVNISGANASITVSGDGSDVVIDLPNANTTGPVSATVYYNIKRNISNSNTKELKTIYVKIDTDTHSANTTGVYSLGVPDVFSIEGVWKVTGNTAYSESGEEVTNDFRLFSNQKDSFYGLSYIASRAGTTISSGDKFLIKAKVFQNTSVTNSFYSVNSYPVDDVTEPLPADKIRTEGIPVYRTGSGKTINLRNAIDFRPHAANTANYSTIIGGATVNPVETLSFSGTSYQFIAPNEAVETSYDYYLGRIDRLILDGRGEFSIIEGVPSENPTAPANPDKTMTLATIYVNPFPSLPIGIANRVNRPQYAVYIQSENTRVYSMRDIQDLDKRIKNLEEYAALTRLEKTAADLVIRDENGLSKFKNGFLVDNFEDLSIADAQSEEYSASIDPAYNEILPKFRAYPLDLVLESSTNTQNFNDMSLLPFTNQTVIEQNTATNTRSCTTNFWRFNGAMEINPELDSTADVSRAPDINITTDLTRPFVDFTNAISQFIPLQSVDNSVVSQNTTTTTTTQNNIRTTSTITETIIDDITRQLQIGSQTNQQSIGDFVTNVEFNPYIRSREIEIKVFGLRPSTRFYFFFDQIDVNAHVAPGTLSGGRVVRSGAYSASNEIKSDANGALYAVFRIPQETFFVGDRELEIHDVALYSDRDSASSSASATYRGFNVSIERTSLTNTTRIPTPNVTTSISRSVSTQVQTQRTVISPPRNRDPIAQTFIIDPSQSTDTNVIITKLDVYFATKSSTNGCTFEIREVDNGYPSGVTLPFSRVHLTSDEIVANNTTAANATTVTFAAPIPLKTGLEYALVVLPDANDPEYRIWISRTGNTDVDTNLAVNQDTNAGVLFTSTNNKTWTPYQDENLKFKLYKAAFTVTSGSINLTNANNEFLILENAPIEDFTENEKVYIDTNGSYLTGTVNIASGNTTIVGISTLFQSEYNEGEHMVVTDGTTTQVLKINSIVSDEEIVVNDIPFITATSTHFKTVTGRVTYYNSIEPATLVLDESSAKTGLVFQGNTSIVGEQSGSTAVISEVYDVPVGYIQTNIFRNNFSKTKTTITGSKLFNGTSTYSKNLEFSDNNYLTGVKTYIQSRSNEVTQNAGEKSFQLQISLETSSTDTSPQVDFGISNVTVYEYLVNNITTNEATIDGQSESKYVSKKVELANTLDAEDIRVLLTAYRPVSTDLEVWVKFQAATDPNEFTDCRCLKWTKLELKPETNSFSSSANRFDYRELEFGLGTSEPASGGAWLDNGEFKYIGKDGEIYNNYKFFAVKIIFLAQNEHIVPRVRDMRAIALT